MIMNASENQIQTYVVHFVKFLPKYVDEWKELLENINRPVEGLVNQAEQLRHVESAKIKDLEDFEERQQRVLYKIYEGIEDEIRLIKEIVDKLNKLNNDYKNKLTRLEEATIGLDWDDKKSTLINGSGTQPALSLLLDYALDFWLFFWSATRDINNSLKSMNARDAKNMNDFGNLFKLDLDSKTVTRLLAITQYINNEKAIV